MDLSLLDILGALKIPALILLGWYLKNKVPSERLQNDVIPVGLFAGNMVLELMNSLVAPTPATASVFGVVPVAINFGFLGALLIPALESVANTGMAMFLHAIGKLGNRRLKKFGT